MKSIETRTVHSEPLRNRQIQPLVMPIYQTSAFSFNSLEEMNGYYEGNGSYLYTRNGNPNTDLLAQTVADLENAPCGVAASSGTGAILAGILSIVQGGDHILAAQDVYGGTVALLKDELSKLGVTVHFVDFANLETVEQHLSNHSEIKLIVSESITNPFLRVENIEGLALLKNRYGVRLMIDNTFATPCVKRPYESGADLVVHSATKYLGGHSDVTAGVLIGEEALVTEAGRRITGMGLSLSPFEAWLTLRGIRTLALRMKAQASNAGNIAAFLKAKGLKVWYPGLGAMVTFELPADTDISRFFASLGWITIVPTLAGVETTVSYPYGTSHRALSEEEKQRVGVNNRIIRLSAGIEGEEDILRQLEQSFKTS